MLHRNYYILAFTLIEIFIVSLLWQNHLKQQNLLESKYINQLQTAYQVVFNTYRLVSQTLYDEIINQPAIINLFKKAYLADETERTIIRNLLYNKLRPTYQRLQTKNLRQLHFHLPDGTSFLRFHKPPKFGDKLFNVRYSVKLANTEKKPVQGFEEGRIFNGFRYVFPLFSDQTHIGSVEISVSFQAIKNEMRHVYPVQYDFVIKKEVVQAKVFNAEQSHYYPSLLSDDYWHEHSEFPPQGSSQSALMGSETRNEINRLLKSRIEPKMTRHLAFAETIRVRQEDFLTTFVPITNVENKNIAYIISYQKESAFIQLINEFYLQLIVLTLANLLFVSFIFHIKRSQQIIEKKHQALRDSEAMFRQVTSSVLDAIIVIDNEGKVTFWNPAAAKIFGYTEAEVIGQNLHALIMPKRYSTDHNKAFNQFQQTGQGTILGKLLELFAVRKTGEEFPVEVSITSLKFKGKWHSVGTVRDITERQQAEEQLRKLSRAVEQSANAIVITDLQGRIEFINPAFSKSTGESYSEVIGETPNFFKSSKQSSQLEQNLWKTIQQGKVWQGELANRRKNGELYWDFVTISPLTDQKGQITHYLAILEDITQRKQIEEKLQSSLQFLETLINTLPIPIYYKDMQGRYLGGNLAFSQFKGDPQEQLIGKTVYDVGNQEFAEIYDKADQELMQQGGQQFYETQMRHFDGSLHTVVFHKATFFEPNGEIGGIIGAFMDITELKQAKEKLQSQNEDLIRLNQEKNEFLGIAAHDLKNPLSAIKGLAEEIMDSFDDMPKEELIEYAGMIQTSSQKMFDLITNLLDVNAIESGKLNFSLSKIDLLPIVQSVIIDFQKSAQIKNIAVQFESQQQTHYAHVDKNTVYQVLENLISNAIKYSPPGKAIYVRLFQKEQVIRCEIQDEGPGLSQADQQKLFGKFTRLTAQPTGGEHSTGLGLFIVKKLVEAMNGAVWCESELGQGAMFVVEFENDLSRTFSE